LKILFVTDGNRFHPSARIRILQYLPLLKLDNFQFQVHYRVLYFDKGFINNVFFFITKRFLRIALFLKISFARYDWIFVQRTLLTNIELQIIKFREKKMIFDVDDGIFLYSAKHKNGFFKMASESKKILVSTPLLKEYLNDYDIKTEIVYSAVDSTVFYGNPASTKEKIIIGWSGSVSTLKYVSAILPEILAVLDKYNHVEFHYICASDELSKFHERIIFHKWSESHEPEMIRNFDIGIMPLNFNEWEKYKGGYKLFMYLMSDVPVLASCIGINKLIIKNDETGFLITEKDEWKSYLELLCSQPFILKRLKEQVEKMDKSYFNLKNNYLILKKSLESG
jgi:glycosyltransferase involved in cell wall biosynthesis